jgi:uncharacterized membrane protein (DUF106 family)
MKKFIKKAFNSRLMLSLASLFYIVWIISSLTEFGIALTNKLEPEVSILIYPFLFICMFASFLTAFFMWLEENLGKSTHKLAT